jgi:NAD(P)-dependent dehydrogenase (short-subunit alcohol dehydrogenase family)
MKLKNHVAIVTGAGSGVGRQIALNFGKQGCKVVSAISISTVRRRLPRRSTNRQA